MQKYHLDSNPGSTPLYGQVKQILIQKIEDGTYPVNSFIPTEKELQEMFQVSRITIRQAIAQLENDGYVQKERAKGTRVLASKIVENMNFISSFHHEMEERGLSCSLDFVNISKMISNKEVSQHLQIKKGSEVIQLYRVYSVEKEPLTVMIDYLPMALDLNLDVDFFSGGGSLYEYLRKEKSIYITRVTDTISIAYASKKISEFLKVKEKSPLLKRTRVSLDQNKRIIEYVVTYYRPEKYMYSVSFGKE